MGAKVKEMRNNMGDVSGAMAGSVAAAVISSSVS
jgi:hypothetical protein